jgi:sortase A
MSIGALLFMGVVVLTCFNIFDEARADKQSEQTAALLHEIIPGYGTSSGGYSAATATEMQTVEIDGQEYIGVLDIPSLSLSLPVSKDWDYSLLKLSPCRYRGSFLDNSMIVAGHNYHEHFGMLYQLQAGDSVIFTDTLGTVYKYKVVMVEILSGNEVDEMESGNWDLTLFTCTLDSKSRVTVRCTRVYS